MKQEDVRKVVREGYAKVARQSSSCCTPKSSCCGGSSPASSKSRKLGYTEEDVSSVPEGANLGLGCGNPIALASLKEGEVVLDLGSGAGFDCFLAAQRVGNTGRVIGVDMTPDMLEKARENIRKSSYRNVEFRLGEIENLPVADGSVDVVISNCVINLSPDKKRVFAEAYRALKPGGRVMVSDIVLLKPLPSAVRESMEAYVGCVAGAMPKDEYLGAMKSAGFQGISIVDEKVVPMRMLGNDEATCGCSPLPAEAVKGLEGAVASVRVSATKPSKK